MVKFLSADSHVYLHLAERNLENLRRKVKRPQLEQESLPQLPELIPIQKAKERRKEVAYVKVTGVQGTSFLKVTEVPEVVSVDNDCEGNNEEVIQLFNAYL